MKKNLLVLVMICGLLAFTNTVWSLTINSGAIGVGLKDTILASDTVNSGYSNELTWVQSVLGPNSTFADSDKTEFQNWNDWYPVDGKSGTWAWKFQNEPQYYFIKIGTGALGGIDDHYLFTNLSELGWAVIELSDISSATNFDITRISHIAPINVIPEPATMLLLGSGLIGLAGVARRRFKK